MRGAKGSVLQTARVELTSREDNDAGNAVSLSTEQANYRGWRRATAAASAVLALSGCANQVAGYAQPLPHTVTVTTEQWPSKTTTPVVPLTTVNRVTPITDNLCNLISVQALEQAMNDPKLPTIAACEARDPQPGSLEAFGHWTFPANNLGSPVAWVEIEVYDDIASDGRSRFKELDQTFPNIKSEYVRNLPGKYDSGAGVTFVQIPDGSGGAADLSMATGLENGMSPGADSVTALGIQNEQINTIGALLPKIFPDYSFAK